MLSEPRFFNNDAYKSKIQIIQSTIETTRETILNWSARWKTIYTLLIGLYE